MAHWIRWFELFWTGDFRYVSWQGDRWFHYKLGMTEKLKNTKAEQIFGGSWCFCLLEQCFFWQFLRPFSVTHPILSSSWDGPLAGSPDETIPSVTQLMSSVNLKKERLHLQLFPKQRNVRKRFRWISIQIPLNGCNFYSTLHGWHFLNSEIHCTMFGAAAQTTLGCWNLQPHLASAVSQDTGTFDCTEQRKEIVAMTGGNPTDLIPAI